MYKAEKCNRKQQNRGKREYDEVDKKLKDLSEKYGTEIGFEGNLFDLCKLLQIKLFTVNFKENEITDGFIVIDDRAIEDFGSKRVIGVNEDLDAYAKRFVIAHELAHYFLEGFDDKGKELPIYANREPLGVKDTGDGLEDKCDYFARCLLMPEKMFIEKYNLYKREENIYWTIEMLSDIFEVSIEGITLRIRDLGLNRGKQIKSEEV